MRMCRIACLLAAAAACWGQVFEVASIKPTTHGRNAAGLSISDDPKILSPGSFSAINNSLDELIRWAFRLKNYQLSGPAWLNDDAVCFDIEAKMPAETTKAQARVMLQALLAEGFGLKIHRETRTLAVYELVPAKGGPKLEAVKPDAKTTLSYEGSFWSTVKSESTTSADLAGLLGDRLQHPVIDKTGIPVRFPVLLEYRISDNDMARPDLFGALQEKLGLNLKKTTGPVEVVVVDHIEKAPVGN